MSEYQYYEFQAIDRPLSQAEMAELRALSSRASISPTRFVNVYNFGDFRGDPAQLMERYFDIFVYVANWGTHRLMLRLPRRLLDEGLAARYSTDEGISVRAAGDAVIADFLSEDEEGGGWVEDEESAAWLPALLPLREELAAGDLRCLYLGWLASAQTGVLDDEVVEPPVPPGLGTLSAALTSLGEFLGIDADLIAAAAERSGARRDTTLSDHDLARWVAALAPAEKDGLLIRLLREDARSLRAELLRRVRAAAAPAGEQAPSAPDAGRTVAQLLAAGEQRAEARKRAEREQAARERERRAREEAAARERYLESITGREPDLWRRVETLIETKRPEDYDRAVQLLCDLRDLAARAAHSDAFAARLHDLRERHSRKSTLMQRLERAGLRA